MAATRQLRTLISGHSAGAATGTLVLVVAFVLTIAAMPAAQAQTFTLLHTFEDGQDGANPYAGVTLDGAGHVYGTTYDGGAHGYGTVYELKLKNGDWTVSPLYEFCSLSNCSDGAYPNSRVIFGPDDSLYGTTTKGGAYGYGTVYKLRPSPSACKSAICYWTLTTLYSFKGTNDGGYPEWGNVILDGTGNIYGTTNQGGGSGKAGTAYELMPSGGGYTENILYAFGGGGDGYYLNCSLAFDSNGNLYGTTYQGGLHGYGIVFQLVPTMGGWTENIIYSFTNGTDGRYPVSGVVIDSSGNLYGTTYAGGSGGAGTVYELTPEPNNNWSFTLLYSFTGNADCGPYDDLAMESGNFYGITNCTGAKNLGAVFMLTPTSKPPWTYTSLHDFTGGNDGKLPYGTVFFDASGNIYGTASAGGSAGIGTAWEITFP